MITPLQPREFFTGLWRGQGELCMRGILRWLVRNQQVRYQGRTTWLSEKVWIAAEEFHLSGAGAVTRTTFLQWVAPLRLHMTCDDVPGGADILLHERGFRFAPYLFRSPLAGGHLTVRCRDEVRLDEDGALHDEIRMSYVGIHLATMSMRIEIDRSLHERAAGDAWVPETVAIDASHAQAPRRPQARREIGAGRSPRSRAGPRIGLPKVTADLLPKPERSRSTQEEL